MLAQSGSDVGTIRGHIKGLRTALKYVSKYCVFLNIDIIVLGSIYNKKPVH